LSEHPQERAFLVGLRVPKQKNVLDTDVSLEELGALADTAGLHVVGQTYQSLSRPNNATFIGKGKVEEIQHWLAELDSGLVLFDDELSPRHQRVLEKAFGQGVKVLDRTALILDIFAQHAQTREGSLQVELAQYEYRLPRLTRQWTHLVRQAGGVSGRGGAAGVGLRGPGETQLESDRREVRRRISALRKDLETVRLHRAQYRRRRQLNGIPLIALVGYTNAGKSTLLNRLSGSNLRTADQLFATLDPTTRRVKLASIGEVLITDTVGFVQKLPHSVIAAFRATLEEIAEADLLLHVIDGSRFDAPEQAAIVENTLTSDLGISGVPILRAINKTDLAQSPEERNAIDVMLRDQNAFEISARHGFGIGALLDRIARELSVVHARVTVRIPISDGKTIARFRACAHVNQESSNDQFLTATGDISPRFLGEFHEFVTG